jgi:DNA-binding MarR family transcriptional regulator
MFDSAPPRAGDVRALAQQLLSWADHLSDRPDLTTELTEQGRHDLVLGLATALRDARRLRAEIFPRISLGNPNWDVMLDLFIQEMNGFRTSLDHLALTGDLPAPVVYESVHELVRIGLIDRTPDRFDNRVSWLSLTVTGSQGMFDLFTQSAEIVRPIARRQPDREDAQV